MALFGLIKKKILVADDDLLVRLMLKEALEPHGFKVEEAAGGDECLKMVYTGSYSLLVLDLHMPGVGGMDVLRALRKHAKYRELPILVLTGDSKSGEVAQAYQLKAKDYILKPFKIDDVVSRVKQHAR